MDSRVGSTPIRAIVAAEWVSSVGSSMTVLALPWFVLATTGSATKLGLVLGIGSIPFVTLPLLGGLADRPDRGKTDDGDRGRGATSAARRNPGALQSRRAVVPAAGRAGRPHQRLHGGAHARAASDPGRGSRRRGEPRRSRERVPRRCANDCAPRRTGPGGRPDRRTRPAERAVRRCCHLRSRRDRRRLVRATEETDERGRGARAAYGCQVHPSKQAARRLVRQRC